MLSIPSFPDPQDPATPIAGAVAWITYLSLDGVGNDGQWVLWVQRSAAAAEALAPPVRDVTLRLGAEMAPGVRVPTLAEMMQDAEFAAAYATILGKLYGYSKLHPLLSDAINA